MKNKAMVITAKPSAVFEKVDKSNDNSYQGNNTALSIINTDCMILMKDSGRYYVNNNQ